MCSIANLLPQEEELSTEQIFAIIDESATFGIKELIFTGGEPFLRSDIFTLTKYAYDNELRTITTTNGTVIDDKTAENIAVSGVGHVHFSLDGLEETNDFFRGKGTFNKIIEGIRILNRARNKSNHFSIGVACTVMDSNVRELSQLVELCDSLGVDVINFQPLVNDNANFLNNTTSIFWVSPKKSSILEQEIERIRNYKPKHITIYEEPHLEALVKYYKKELTKKDWVCFGGFKTVFICYSKREPLVYSCHGICGNLDKISLKSAWKSKEAYKLRIHSQNCRNLCMQSCYSQESAQSLSNLARFYIKKIKNYG